MGLRPKISTDPSVYFNLAVKSNAYKVSDFESLILVFPQKPRFFIQKKYLYPSLLYLTENVNYGRLSLTILAFLINLLLSILKVIGYKNGGIILYISTNGIKFFNLIINIEKGTVEKFIYDSDDEYLNKKYQMRRLVQKGPFKDYAPVLTNLQIVDNILYSEEEIIRFKRVWSKSKMIPKVLDFFEFYFNYINQERSNGETLFHVHGDFAYWNLAISDIGTLRIYDFDEYELSKDYLQDFIRFFKSVPISKHQKLKIIKKFYKSKLAKLEFLDCNQQMLIERILGSGISVNGTSKRATY